MSPESAAPTLITYEPKPVDIERIERELAQLWGPPPESPEEEAPVTRACMSNLIIFCATQTQASTIPQEVSSIVQQHPSRVLLLVAEISQRDSAMEAYVSAHCHLAGGSQQICSEHITVNAGAGAAPRLPSVARSLLIGDLPTALWWAASTAPPLGGDLFQELAAMTSQVIYDSQGWPDPVRGVVATANWAANDETDQIASDLAWRRLKPWRRLISQSLDPTIEPGALESIHEVVVQHGPHALPQAWLLIGWLACRLGWRPADGKVAPGVDVTWGFHSAKGRVNVTVQRLSEGEPEVHSVSVSWRSAGQHTTAKFRVAGPGRLEVAIDGSEAPSRCLIARPQPRAALVARQLPDLGRDTLFRDTLVVSRTMAESIAR